MNRLIFDVKTYTARTHYRIVCSICRIKLVLQNRMHSIFDQLDVILPYEFKLVMIWTKMTHKHHLLSPISQKISFGNAFDYSFTTINFKTTLNYSQLSKSEHESTEIKQVALCLCIGILCIGYYGDPFSWHMSASNTHTHTNVSVW